MRRAQWQSPVAVATCRWHPHQSMRTHRRAERTERNYNCRATRHACSATVDRSGRARRVTRPYHYATQQGCQHARGNCDDERMSGTRRETAAHHLMIQSYSPPRGLARSGRSMLPITANDVSACDARLTSAAVVQTVFAECETAMDTGHVGQQLRLYDVTQSACHTHIRTTVFYLDLLSRWAMGSTTTQA